MYMLYYILFGVGLGYTVISAIIGNIFDISEFGDDFMPEGLSFFKPAIIACYITVLGGVGLIFYNYEYSFFGIAVENKNYSLAITFLVAQIFAFFASNVFNRYFIKPLSKAQNTSAAEREEMIGAIGKVTETILENGFGKISFIVKGNTISSPAKSIDNTVISANTIIKIVDIKKNIFYVEKESV